MKILFICASLEPGCDGIGDYSQRLAHEIVRQGHDCLCLGINDRFVASGHAESFARCLDFAQNPTVFRMEASRDWDSRVEISQRLLNAFGPDWISLQFGPFAYHPKGLSTRLERDIKALTSGCRLHVMCHELWIGKTFPVAFRHKLLGKIQKPLVRHLFNSLKPDVVHTHLPYYQSMLGTIGVDGKLLPLHGNIRVSSSRAEAREWLCRRVRSNGDEFMAGFFGNILSTINIDAACEFAKSAAGAGGKLHVLSAGRLDAGGEHLWRAMATKLDAAAKFTLLGPLSEQEVSKYLAALDLGLTSYPGELAGKSGGVASMLEHGVRVLCLGRFHGQQAAAEGSFIEIASASSAALTASRFLDDIAQASLQTS